MNKENNNKEQQQEVKNNANETAAKQEQKQEQKQEKQETANANKEQEFENPAETEKKSAGDKAKAFLGKKGVKETLIGIGSVLVWEAGKAIVGCFTKKD